MKLVFVSSTFRDMQHERDAISASVAPRLDAFLERYAESVHFGDLRWGVNTTELESEESSKKVLSVCLDQIDDSRPYMIVLIGERYGWIPAYELLHESALLKGIDESVIDENTSVTNLEIEYGALLNPDYEGRILFYFRNPLDTSKMSKEKRADYECESSVHRAKMDALKAKILEKYPGYVRYYDAYYDESDGCVKGLEPLCDMIYEDLLRIFDIDLSYVNSLPKEKRALLSSEKHFEKLYQNSFVRDASYLNYFDIDDIEYFYEARYEHNPVLEILQGESGAGAKTMVAQEYSVCKEREENALCFSFGIDEFTATLSQFKGALAYTLECYLGMEPSGESSVEYVSTLLEKYVNDKNLPYLRIFAVNAPKSIITFLTSLSVLMPNLFGVGFHIHMKRTLDPDTPIPFFPKSIVTDVEALTKKEAKEVIRSVLKTKRKELADVVISEMVKHKGSKSPLYLSLLTQRLIMLDSEDFACIRKMGDGMDNINKYMISLIKKAGKDIRELSRELLSELTERINPEMAKHLIAHMTLKNHFSEKGLMQLFAFANWHFTQLDYTVFKRTFPALMYEDSKGMLFFANEEIKNGALDLLSDLGATNDLDTVIDFLKTQSRVYRRKALARFLYEKGDYIGVLDEYLPCIDKSGQELRENEDVHKEFSDCMHYLSWILSDALETNRSFALDLIKELVLRIKDGRVKNPYSVLSFLFEFIDPDYSNMAEVSNAFDMCIDIVDIIESTNGFSECEPLFDARSIIYVIYMPTFSGMGTTDRQITFYKSRYLTFAKSADGKGCSAHLLELMRQGKLNLMRVLGRSSSSIMHLYKIIRALASPMQNPAFEDFLNTCNGLEAHLEKMASDHLLKLLNKEREPSDFVEVLFLGINAYRYSVTGNSVMADAYYLAFYNCFDSKLKNGEIDTFYLTSYIDILCDMCTYFVVNKKDYASAIYDSVLEFIEGRVALHSHNCNACASLMKLLILGSEHEILSKSANHVYLPFEIALKRLGYVSDPDAIGVAFDFFEAFDFIFTEEEKSYYFSELIYQMVRALVRANADDTKIIIHITEYIYLYLNDKENAMDFFNDIICEITYLYPDVFEMSDEEYASLAEKTVDELEA